MPGGGAHAGPSAPALLEGDDLVAEQQGGAGVARAHGERGGDAGVVDDRGVRGVQRPQADARAARPRGARRRRPAARRVPRWRPRGRAARRAGRTRARRGPPRPCRTPRRRRRARSANSRSRCTPRRHSRRLEAARLVVEPGVHDAAVVAGLVRREPFLLLEQGHLGAGQPPGQLPRDGRADDAAADHRGPACSRRRSEERRAPNRYVAGVADSETGLATVRTDGPGGRVVDDRPAPARAALPARTPGRGR